MSLVNLIQTNLNSKGYKIFEAKIESNTYYLFQQSEEYDLSFKQKDSKVSSKFLRSLTQIANSKYQLYEYHGRLLLADLKQLAENEILKILEQLLVAIYNLHSQNTMGRCFDIENIIITQSNDIMLMDFGFCSPLKYKPIEFVTQFYQNGTPYDISFDLFLIGKIGYYLVIGYDIPVAEDFSVQWETLQKQIKDSVYSSQLKNIIIKLLEPNPKLRLDFIKLSQMLKSSFHKEIEYFYTHQISNLNKHLIEIIKERDQELHSRILKPPPLPSPGKYQQLNLIFKLEPLDKGINKILNFNLYKITLLKQAKQQLQDLFFPLKSTNISIILSHFALQKMYCVTFLEIGNLLKARKWENISKEEIELFHNSNGCSQLQQLIDNYIYTEQESMATYINNTINDLNKLFPEYKAKKLYQETAPILSNNCQGLTFDKIKHEYRLPLNNLINIIEQQINEQVFARFRLLILMNILINKIVNIELLEKHFNTVKSTLKISKITTPHQIDLFLNNATIEQLNQQYLELQAFHFPKK